MFRLCPNRPLPPYSYVPKRFPHPISHPDGHSYSESGHSADAPVTDATLSEPPSLIAWPPPDDFLFGIDLFNHAFYWEAHEIWEQLWIACGRTGRDADFLKALIKLAAAGVKLREGNAVGITRHANRAHQLLQLVQSQLPADQTDLAGLNLASLIKAAATVASTAESLIAQNPDPIHNTLPIRLNPSFVNRSSKSS